MGSKISLCCISEIYPDANSFNFPSFPACNNMIPATKAFLRLMLRRTPCIFRNCIKTWKFDSRMSFQLKIPNGIIDLIINISEQGILAEELITLQNDFELKPKFNISYQSFWLHSEFKVKCTRVWNWVKIFFIAYPSSYLVQCAFSVLLRF